MRPRTNALSSAKPELVSLSDNQAALGLRADLGRAIAPGSSQTLPAVSIPSEPTVEVSVVNATKAPVVGARVWLGETPGSRRELLAFG